MIPQKKQVASLELSMQLEKLGVKQDTLLYWIQYTTSDGLKGEWIVTQLYDPWGGTIKLYSAPTVAELGEMLPARIKTYYGSWNYLHITKLENSKEWIVTYYHDEIKGNTLANACAKMLIYLIENKLMQV